MARSNKESEFREASKRVTVKIELYPEDRKFKIYYQDGTVLFGLPGYKEQFAILNFLAHQKGRQASLTDIAEAVYGKTRGENGIKKTRDDIHQLATRIFGDTMYRAAITSTVTNESTYYQCVVPIEIKNLE